MNIAHLNTEISWRGGEVQVFYLALGLAQRNHTNFLILQPEGTLAKRVEATREPSLQNNLKVIAIKMKGELDVKAIWQIAQVLRRRQVHILHMHAAHAVTLGSLAGKIARIPVLIASRRVHFPLRSGFLSRFKYQWGIDKIIAVSREVQNQLLKTGIKEDKITVVPSGVDLSRFNPNVPSNRLRQELNLSENAPLIGIIGHLSPEKGHPLWIQAVPGILKEVPDVKFVLVGEGPLQQILQGQIDTLGLNKTIYLLGFRSDIPEILADVDILLSTSLSEGSPGSVKEAMAMGKPVVALNVGGVHEVITNDIEGILLPYPENRLLKLISESSGGEIIQGLVTAVVSLLKDKEKRHKMGQAAIEKIRAYSMDAMIERTEAVYLELLGKKGISFLL